MIMGSREQTKKRRRAEAAAKVVAAQDARIRARTLARIDAKRHAAQQRSRRIALKILKRKDADWPKLLAKAAVSALLLICLSGCKAPEASVDADQYRPYVAAKLALVASTPAPGPVPDDNATHPRAECPTNGWITHGDGHRSRCPNCDPPWTSDEPTEPDDTEDTKKPLDAASDEPSSKPSKDRADKPANASQRRTEAPATSAEPQYRWERRGLFGRRRVRVRVNRPSSQPQASSFRAARRVNC